MTCACLTFVNDGVAQRLADGWRTPQRARRVAGASAAARGRVVRGRRGSGAYGWWTGTGACGLHCAAGPGTVRGLCARAHRPIPRSPCSRVRRTASRRSQCARVLGRGWRRPLRVRGSSISVKNSGIERIWAALSMVFGAPLCRVGSSVSAGQLPARIAGQGIEKHTLRCRSLVISATETPEPAGVSHHAQVRWRGRPCHGTGPGQQTSPTAAADGRNGLANHARSGARTTPAPATRDCDGAAPAEAAGGCCWRPDEAVHTGCGNPSPPLRH